MGGYIAGYDPQKAVQYYIAERRLLCQEAALEELHYNKPFAITANALLPRRVIEEVGGFDPLCNLSGEDADLCWRIGETGRRIVFAPWALVYHRHRSSVRGLCRWMFRYAIGSVYLMKKHRRLYGLGRVFIHWPHYGRFFVARGLFLAPPFCYRDSWERLFAGYDLLRLVCFTAGRVVGSIRYRAIVL